MAQRKPKPKDVGFFDALFMLSEREHKVVNAYVLSRVLVKGCEEDKLTPVELMQWLTTKPGEQAAS